MRWYLLQVVLGLGMIACGGEFMRGVTGAGPSGQPSDSHGGDDDRDQLPDATPVPTPFVASEKSRTSIPLPGRGIALAWKPDGSQVAVGGHMVDRARNNMRYDTKIYDVVRGEYVKAFGSHYWWVVALAWQDNPFLGEVIADGGGDHAAKIWLADGAGTLRTERGQYEISDGAVPGLPAPGLGQINGWITSLAYSPDGRYLAGASRDRILRIWQVEPGRNQFKVVKAFYDASIGNLLGVSWSPDGQSLAASEREDTVSLYHFSNLWSDAVVDDFARQDFDVAPRWANNNPDATGDAALWTSRGFGPAWMVKFAPDGRTLAVAGVKRSAIISAETGAEVFPLHGGGLAVDFSHDNLLVALGCQDQRIYIYDGRLGTLLQTLEGSEDDVSDVAWSPVAPVLASTAGGQRVSLATNELVEGPDMNIRLWELAIASP